MIQSTVKVINRERGWTGWLTVEMTKYKAVWIFFLPKRPEMPKGGNGKC